MSSAGTKERRAIPQNLERLNDEELLILDQFAEFLIKTRGREETRRRFEEARAEWARRTADVDGQSLEALINDAVLAVRATP